MHDTLTADHSTTANEADEICDAVGRSFDRVFSRSGINRKTVKSTFEASLEGLRKAKNPELRMRSIAKSAALSTGRSHGNVVETGRLLMDGLSELATSFGFRPDLAKEQVLLGLAEGACQLGPVVYCRFLDVANTYKEGADEWITRNRRLPALIEPSQLPIIVPYENELTLQPSESEFTPSVEKTDLEEVPTTTERQWERPKQRSFFRRLSEAVGHFFGN